ncbi:MAG: cupin domain-containing protein [Euryarchaeota archaeon]|nr:cupin domain-containing protein [Euryarchaeota archaeon]
MASVLIKSGDIRFEPHPKFSGVEIAKLITSERNSEVSVSILKISPGNSASVHLHEREVDSIYILKGTGKAYVNGEWVTVAEGDYIFVPPGEEHGIENTGEEALILLATHAPPLF